MMCKGCRSYLESDCDLAEKQETILIKCPCLICLIKGMCRDACEDHKTYWDDWKFA